MLFGKLLKVSRKQANKKNPQKFNVMITFYVLLLIVHPLMVKAGTKLSTLCQIRLKLFVFNQYDLKDWRKWKESMVVYCHISFFFQNVMHKNKTSRIYNS